MQVQKGDRRNYQIARVRGENASDDILIKIGVGKETDSQPYLGRESPALPPPAT